MDFAATLWMREARKMQRKRDRALKREKYKVGGVAFKPTIAGRTHDFVGNKRHITKLMERVNANVHK